MAPGSSKNEDRSVGVIQESSRGPVRGWIPAFRGAFRSNRLKAELQPPPRLQVLDLGANWIGDSGAKALATSPLARRLTVLNLRGNGIGDAGHRALAAAPQLAGLRALYLEGNCFRTNSEEALRARFGERVHF
jgi:hypothetical protein